MRLALLLLLGLPGPAFCGIETIFGKDDRAPLGAIGAPWTAIGRLEREGGGFCTGSLVGPDILLTAAHCVIDEEGRSYQGLVFRAFQTLNASAAESAVMECRNEKSCRIGARVWTSDRDEDWALVRLENAIDGAVGTLPVRPLNIMNADTLRDTLLTSVGYSARVMDGLVPLVEKGCKLRRAFRPQPALYNDCDIWQGMSGGPLLLLDERGAPFIIAIITEGNPNHIEKYSDAESNIALDANAFAPTLQVLLKEGW